MMKLLRRCSLVCGAWELLSEGVRIVEALTMNGGGIGGGKGGGGAVSSHEGIGGEGVGGGLAGVEGHRQGLGGIAQDLSGVS